MARRSAADDQAQVAFDGHGMDILDQLKQERERRAGNGAGAAEGVADERLQRAMESFYAGLERFVDGLAELDLDVRASYEIEAVGTLSNLRQCDYAIETEDPLLPRFTLEFKCVGEHPLTHVSETIAHKEHARESVTAHGLELAIDDMSTWRYVITVRPLVPVRLVFEPTPDGEAIRVTVRNLGRLGIELFSVYPEAVRPELINELGKMIIRRENRFAEHCGNRVPAATRERLQQRVQSRERSREQVGRELQAEARPGGLRGLLRSPRRGGGQVAGTRPPAGAPDIDGNPPQSDPGYIDWNAPGGETRPASAFGAAARTAPAPKPKATGVRATHAPYAWMITLDALAEDTSESVGRHGPSGTSKRFSTATILTKGAQFRLLARDGGNKYSGRIVGEFQGIEPLVDFGLDHGCYLIEYLRDGAWVRVRATD